MNPPADKCPAPSNLICLPSCQFGQALLRKGSSRTRANICPGFDLAIGFPSSNRILFRLPTTLTLRLWTTPSRRPHGNSLAAPIVSPQAGQMLFASFSILRALSLSKNARCKLLLSRDLLNRANKLAARQVNNLRCSGALNN